MTPHPPPEALAAWSAGELPIAEVAALEAHVDRCPRCAEALCRAAQLELALTEVARAHHRAAPRGWRLPVASLAIAAAALLALATRAPAPEAPEPAAAQLSCADDPGDPRCVERATRRGLMIDPSAIPRYEDARLCARCGAERGG